jgi:hypothetical protein
VRTQLANMRCSIRRSKTAIAFIALSVLIAPAVGSCKPQRTVGRVEALYKSMGGPEFVGTDGGTDQNIVNRWFEADISRSDCYSSHPLGPSTLPQHQVTSTLPQIIEPTHNTAGLVRMSRPAVIFVFPGNQDSKCGDI